MTEPRRGLDGALLINKPAGISSFGVIDQLSQAMCKGSGLRKRELPKMGHGGTLDPFATGLIVVCVGRAVKLARYFLGSSKTYEGVMRFGQTTVPGDPTAPVSETSDVLPSSLLQIQETARLLTQQPYLQMPPMHSAKKKEGVPLYELARQGIEVDREPKTCHLYKFDILDYAPPTARFRVTCSSGTYIRTLAQDLARLLGSVAMLDSLDRTACGIHATPIALTLDQILASEHLGKLSLDQLGCWVPFDALLDGYERAAATDEEARALFEGRQKVLFSILRRIQPAPRPSHTPISDEYRDHVAIFQGSALIAVANRAQGEWGLERVFTGA